MKFYRNFKPFILFISIHILVGQIGLNVFNFSCYCKKAIQTSLLPHADECGHSGLITNSCCSNSGSCKISHEEPSKKSCGKSETEYKKLNTESYSLDSKSFHFVAEAPVLFQLINPATSYSSNFIKPTISKDQRQRSGWFIRLEYASLTC
ncbi:MAG: hypothetical protein IPI50_09705 [Saprospiraceae bacterium]|nr:hypothetical protein [Saprospiraceae bacterium]